MLRRKWPSRCRNRSWRTWILISYRRKNARLYVNGVLAAERVPAKRVTIPANSVIHVKVDDGNGNTDETTVQPLNRNQRKRVVLFPQNRSKSE